MASEPAARPLWEPAPAKVNLFLRVTGRRPDGYHVLESLAVFAAAADRIQALPVPNEAGGSGGGGSPPPTLTLSLQGPFAVNLSAGADNLVFRAARALPGSQGAALTLEKNLPVASGIGGGSADAAATLRVLARLWGTPPAGPALAVKLGADVPVCLASTPQIMRGIGEVLSPAPRLPPYGLALVNPGVGVATADIFRARQGKFSLPVRLPPAWPDAAAMAADMAAWGNDLQPPAEALCPPIKTVLAALRAVPGCLLAQMSGSGATCFGLFATPVAAAAAAAQLARPGWWSWGGAPFEPGAVAA